MLRDKDVGLDRSLDEKQVILLSWLEAREERRERK